MALKFRALSLLVLSLLAPGLPAADTRPEAPSPPRQAAPAAAATPAAEPTEAPAQAAAAATAPAVPVVDPESIKALQSMGAALQSLNRFRVTAAIDSEKVLDDGQKVQRGSFNELLVQRPNRLRVNARSVQAERQLYYDGKQLSLYTPALNFYSTVPAPDTLGGLDALFVNEYRMSLPMADLFRWGTENAPSDEIVSALYAGQDLVGTDTCDQYVFRQGEVDWQIWIKTRGPRLPCKVVITNRADEARPQYSAVYTWTLKPTFTNQVFKFTPPKGAKPIRLTPSDVVNRTN
jgi:hypothetical protein